MSAGVTQQFVTESDCEQRLVTTRWALGVLATLLLSLLAGTGAVASWSWQAGAGVRVNQTKIEAAEKQVDEGIDRIEQHLLRIEAKVDALGARP